MVRHLLGRALVRMEELLAIVVVLAGLPQERRGLPFMRAVTAVLVQAIRVLVGVVLEV